MFFLTNFSNVVYRFLDHNSEVLRGLLFLNLEKSISLEILIVTLLTWVCIAVRTSSSHIFKPLTGWVALWQQIQRAITTALSGCWNFGLFERGQNSEQDECIFLQFNSDSSPAATNEARNLKIRFLMKI